MDHHLSFDIQEIECHRLSRYNKTHRVMNYATLTMDERTDGRKKRPNRSLSYSNDTMNNQFYKFGRYNGLIRFISYSNDTKVVDDHRFDGNKRAKRSISYSTDIPTHVVASKRHHSLQCIINKRTARAISLLDDAKFVPARRQMMQNYHDPIIISLLNSGFQRYISACSDVTDDEITRQILMVDNAENDPSTTQEGKDEDISFGHYNEQRNLMIKDLLMTIQNVEQHFKSRNIVPSKVNLPMLPHFNSVSIVEDLHTYSRYLTAIAKSEQSFLQFNLYHIVYTGEIQSVKNKLSALLSVMAIGTLQIYIDNEMIPNLPINHQSEYQACVLEILSELKHYLLNMNT